MKGGTVGTRQVQRAELTLRWEIRCAIPLRAVKLNHKCP